MRKIIFILCCGLVALNIGCVKDDNAPDITNPKTMDELNASSDFNWSTSATYTIEVEGLPTDQPIKNTLIITDNAGNVFYTGFHAMSENLTLKLVVPKSIKELNLSFGEIKQKASVVNGKVNFSFIPVLIVM